MSTGWPPWSEIPCGSSCHSNQLRAPPCARPRAPAPGYAVGEAADQVAGLGAQQSGAVMMGVGGAGGAACRDGQQAGSESQAAAGRSTARGPWRGRWACGRRGGVPWGAPSRARTALNPPDQTRASCRVSDKLRCQSRRGTIQRIGHVPSEGSPSVSRQRPAGAHPCSPGAPRSSARQRSASSASVFIQPSPGRDPDWGVFRRRQRLPFAARCSGEEGLLGVRRGHVAVPTDPCVRAWA